MLGLFDSAKSSLLKLETVTTDNPVFRLHYKVTFAILVTFTILVTSKQYIGDPIDCIVEGISPDIMDTYCWIHSTFTVPEATKVGQAVAHPGKEVLKPYRYCPHPLYMKPALLKKPHASFSKFIKE